MPTSADQPPPSPGADGPATPGSIWWRPPIVRAWQCDQCQATGVIDLWWLGDRSTTRLCDTCALPYLADEETKRQKMLARRERQLKRREKRRTTTLDFSEPIQ